MEQDNSKILTVSFVAAGFIVGVVVKVLMQTLQAVSGFFVQMNSIEAVSHGLPIGAGILTFVLLQFNPKVRVWADECVMEVRKVVWPSRKDVTAMTTVVCVMLLVAGLIFGIFDLLAGNLIKLMVS